MAHDREFQRKRKDTRMPVRGFPRKRIERGEAQPDSKTDFDLRRARDTPSSVNGKTHRQDIPVQTEFSHLSPETRRPCWNRAKRMQPLWIVFGTL